MAFSATPKDSGGIPVGCVYIPNIGFVALQGLQSSTDGSGNASALVLSNVDNVSIIASSAFTTTQTSADLTNYAGRGVVVVLDMTTVGTGSVTITIKGKEPVSGKYYTILTGAAVTTNSTNIYRIYPSLTAVANATVQDILPRTWQVIVTANNANSCTYSVSCMYSL